MDIQVLLHISMMKSPCLGTEQSSGSPSRSQAWVENRLGLPFEEEQNKPIAKCSRRKPQR